MSITIKIPDQVLALNDARPETVSVVRKYDAFLNLLSVPAYAFQRDAIRAALRFLASDKYPSLERLARENWNDRPVLQQRYESVDLLIERMPLRDRKAVSIDIATGGGKSFVMYGLAAIALAEGMVDRVLVLCPSLTIEDGLLDKFSTLAGNGELTEIMKELGAVVPTPGIKRGNETIQPGDICVENIHAVYESTGSSIRDSFQGQGERTLVLNDEAHHLFSNERGVRKWMEFLQSPDFGFCHIVSLTGTPYTGDDYFPDVIFRYGLKSAIEDRIVKKPDYKTEDSLKDHDWQETYAFHVENRKVYGKKVKPLTIVVTQEISTCVEVWRELVSFLAAKEKITNEKAEAKAIWVTSGIPSNLDAKRRIELAYASRGEGDSPEKRRKENLAALKTVDDADSPVEWIVSVSMLTEGWDVKNVFQIVPHESRAFNSKLLIQQVLGRGLRVPPGFDVQPLVRINNHEKWAPAIGNLLKEVLEIESTLTWGPDPRHAKFLFPLHNLRYELEQKTVETKREKAREPIVEFVPQDRKTIEHAVFSESGRRETEIEHRDLYDIDDAVKMVRLFIREKDTELGAKWTKKRIREFIVAGLRKGGYDETFLSKANLLRLQHSFGPMFRELDKSHPRMSQAAKDLFEVDLQRIPRQSFSESSLRECGAVWSVDGDQTPFPSEELLLWRQYLGWKKQADVDESVMKENFVEIARAIRTVPASAFKSPWNVHYVTHAPETTFSAELFANAALFESFVKMPNVGGYSFPYSYKPAGIAKTHVSNESFNPDFFLRLDGSHDILVVEIKDDDDDSNRNRAKCRDGAKHFETVNARLEEAGEPWRYHFYFLSPADYSNFFQQVRNRTHAGWRSALMSQLASEYDRRRLLSM